MCTRNRCGKSILNRSLRYCKHCANTQKICPDLLFVRIELQSQQNYLQLYFPSWNPIRSSFPAIFHGIFCAQLFGTLKWPEKKAFDINAHYFRLDSIKWKRIVKCQSLWIKSKHEMVHSKIACELLGDVIVWHRFSTSQSAIDICSLISFQIVFFSIMLEFAE